MWSPSLWSSTRSRSAAVNGADSRVSQPHGIALRREQGRLDDHTGPAATAVHLVMVCLAQRVDPVLVVCARRSVPLAVRDRRFVMHVHGEFATPAAAVRVRQRCLAGEVPHVVDLDRPDTRRGTPASLAREQLVAAPPAPTEVVRAEREDTAVEDVGDVGGRRGRGRGGHVHSITTIPVGETPFTSGYATVRRVDNRRGRAAGVLASATAGDRVYRPGSNRDEAPPVGEARRVIAKRRGHRTPGRRRGAPVTAPDGTRRP